MNQEVRKIVGKLEKGTADSLDVIRLGELAKRVNFMRH